MSKSCGYFIGLMFLDRDLTHRQHLKTKSYAEHKALEGFYEAIVGLADEFAEQYQGATGERLEVPLVENEAEGEIDKVLTEHLSWIQDNRNDICKKDDSALQNSIDEIVAQYRKTLYLLTLK